MFLLCQDKNQSRKPLDLKIIFLFLFDILYFQCAHRYGGDSVFAGISALKCV